MYKKDTEGIHYYKEEPSGTVLHVLLITEDKHIESHQGDYQITGTLKKGEHLINRISKIPNAIDLVDCTETEFYKVLIDAMKDLNILLSASA